MAGEDDTSDWERVRSGDERAFETLFRLYYRRLYLIALGSVRDHAMAEEIAQEVLMELWFRRAAVEIRVALKAYLYSAARKKAVDYIRRAARSHKHRSLLATHPAYASDRVVDSAQDALTTQEIDPALLRAIAQLPDRQREIFTLRAAGELSYAEIAEVLGTSVKNVEVQLRRAVHTLRARLGENPPVTFHET